MGNKIIVAELQNAFNSIVKKLIEDNYSYIETEVDEYWNIPGENLFDFISSPELSIGSLSDDLQFLRQHLESEDYITFSDLDRLAAILKIIRTIVIPVS